MAKLNTLSIYWYSSILAGEHKAGYVFLYWQDWKDSIGIGLYLTE